MFNLVLINRSKISLSFQTSFSCTNSMKMHDQDRSSSCKFCYIYLVQKQGFLSHLGFSNKLTLESIKNYFKAVEPTVAHSSSQVDVLVETAWTGWRLVNYYEIDARHDFSYTTFLSFLQNFLGKNLYRLSYYDKIINWRGYTCFVKGNLGFQAK